jgi:hypothetical protein
VQEARYDDGHCDWDCNHPDSDCQPYDVCMLENSYGDGHCETYCNWRDSDCGDDYGLGCPRDDYCEPGCDGYDPDCGDCSADGACNPQCGDLDTDCLDPCETEDRYEDGNCDWDCHGYDPDCFRHDRCEDLGLYGDGNCDRSCDQPDPDCGEASDWCLAQGRYGDGDCDPSCPQYDRDCDGTVDWCERLGLYNDELCQACPNPDPNCTEGPGATGPTRVALIASDGLLTDAVLLTWYPLDGASSYRLERSLSPLDGFALVTEVGDTAEDFMTHLDESVTPNAVYYYRVVASASGAEVGDSEVDAGHAGLSADCGEPPVKPAGLTLTLAADDGDADPGTNQVVVQWDLDPCARQYRVYGGRSGSTPWDMDGPIYYTYADQGWQGTAFVEVDLFAGVPIEYWVVASNAYGDSEPSDGAQLTIPAPPGPVMLSAEPVDTRHMMVTWEHTQPPALSYELMVTRDPTGEWWYGACGTEGIDSFCQHHEVAEMLWTAALDTGAPLPAEGDQVTVYYAARAVGENYIGALSAEPLAASFTMPAAPHPPPSGLSTCDVRVFDLCVQWNQTLEAQSYRWYMATSPAGPFELQGETSYPWQQSATVADLQPNTSYWLAVSAVRSDGWESALCEALEVRTLLDFMQQPPTVEAVAGGIALSWQPHGGAVSYAILRTDSCAVSYSQIADVQGTSWIDATTQPGVSYYYLVVPVDNLGRRGAYSESCSGDGVQMLPP